MKIKHVACAMLIATDGKILIQKREGISKYGEEWSFFGGGIEPGETAWEALAREMREELELDISGWTRADLGETVHVIPGYDLEYHRHIFALHIPAWRTGFVDREWAGAYFRTPEEVLGMKFNTPVHEEMARVAEYLVGHA